MMASIAATLLISAALAAQVRRADALPLDGATGHICIACKAGDEQSCDELVRLNKEHRVNVCDARSAAGDAIRPSNVEYNENYFEGDIYQPRDAGAMSQYAALAKANSRWSGGVVPYDFASTLDRAEMAMIKAAMEHVEESTCVRLRRRSDENDWVQFTNTHAGCFSAIGRVGGMQTVNLNVAEGCLQALGTPVHEILHALGFVHEHTRPDRDEYIEVHWDNIRRRMADNFHKWPSRQVDTAGTQYDYGSVMHYPSWAFAVDRRRPTLTPKESGATLGQRAGLSASDVEEVNAAYDCGGPAGSTRRPPWTSRRTAWPPPPPPPPPPSPPPSQSCLDGSAWCRHLRVACSVECVARLCPAACGMCDFLPGYEWV